MLEQQIQSKIIKRLESQGWYVIKIIKCSKNGIPDLVAIKDGVVKFFEVKRPQIGIVSEIQKFRIKELQEHGIEATVITSEQDL